MAGGDTDKDLLSIIRNFAGEKSQGERRIYDLKKQIQELRSELDTANAELEDAKNSKETVEQDLRGHEVELAMSEASIQAQEARISMIQEEVSKVGSDLEALKNDEGVSRDEFISQMFEFNKKIRKFQETIAHTFHEEKCVEPSSYDGHKLEDKQDTEVALSGLEDKLANIISQTLVEEQEYQEIQDIHKQVQRELVDYERQVSLIEEVVKETKELQELTSYICGPRDAENVSLTGNKQTAESERVCASLGEELQRRCVCPSCHLDNVGGALGGILQGHEGN